MAEVSYSQMEIFLITIDTKRVAYMSRKEKYYRPILQRKYKAALKIVTYVGLLFSIPGLIRSRIKSILPESSGLEIKSKTLLLAFTLVKSACFIE